GITQLQSASAAMGRVFEFLNETNMQEDKHKVLNLPKFKGHVSFEHVKFGYSDNKTIIHDFTSEAQPGQKVAIVGPTGAGKT
ncbi:ABC transporter ATP-binding protein, partial [Streptococcus agalactiae]